MTRKLKDGSVFFPDQRMSRMEALRSYTIECAKAAFEEDLKGSLRPGKLADIVVLERDPYTSDPYTIHAIKVDHTFSDGRLVYSRMEHAFRE